MSKNKLSPWTIELEHDETWPFRAWTICEDESHGAVASVYCITNAEKTFSNLRLISATPELYQSLKDLLEQLEGIGIPDWAGAEGLCLEQARKAIAKAEHISKKDLDEITTLKEHEI